MRQKTFFKEISLIDQHSPKPKYRQLVENVILAIDKGIITGGQRLPSLNEVADEYDVARVTVSKGYDRLKDRNIIIAHHGKGFFIASTPDNADPGCHHVQ